MELLVRPTPTRFPTNSLYNPMDNSPLQSISSVCHPWLLSPVVWKGLFAQCVNCVGDLPIYVPYRRLVGDGLTGWKLSALISLLALSADVLAAS